MYYTSYRNYLKTMTTMSRTGLTGTIKTTIARKYARIHVYFKTLLPIPKRPTTKQQPKF